METIWDFGVKLILAFQGLGDWQTPLMKFFSFLGTEEFFMIVLPVLFWCVDTNLGLRVGLLLMVSGCVNDALKLTFHGPRPYWYSTQVKAFAAETSFGVPSGHAQNAIAVWGPMAAWLRKWWAWLVAGLVILLIGLSRLYLAVHFPHDVLLGWLLGGLLLWLMLRFWDPAAAWLKKRSLGIQILIAFLAALVLILLSAIPFVWLTATNWQPPQAWASFAADAVSLEGAFTSGGALFGLGVGFAWLTRLGGFKTAGPFWKLVLRYVLGLVGVLIIWMGLDMLFDVDVLVLAFILRFIRYALVGFWVTGLAPWIFLRLKLAEKAA